MVCATFVLLIVASFSTALQLVDNSLGELEKQSGNENIHVLSKLEKLQNVNELEEATKGSSQHVGLPSYCRYVEYMNPNCRVLFGIRFCPKPQTMVRKICTSVDKKGLFYK